MALTDGADIITLTEAFDGSDHENATLSIVQDGTPHFHVETVVNGQAAWTYEIFFVSPYLANVPELVVADQDTGERRARAPSQQEVRCRNSDEDSDVKPTLLRQEGVRGDLQILWR